MPMLRIIPDLDGATPEYAGKEAVEVQDFIVGGLPSGMASGKPSVAFLIDLPDGRYVFAQTSLQLFLAAADALKARYGDPRPSTTPDDVERAEAAIAKMHEVLSTKDPRVTPVSASKTLTTDRADPRLHKPRADGQNEAYLVLSDEERAKGYVRPVRTQYKHVACGCVTTMGTALAETYARDPKFYGATFCVGCGEHFSLTRADGSAAFVWDRDGEPVGS